MDNRYFRILVLAISCLFIVVFISFTFLILYFVFSPPTSPTPIPLSTYQLVNVNPSRSTTFFGTADISQVVNPNYFLSYSTPQSGDTIFIKPFGGNDYICTGSCFCRESNPRRVTSSSSNLLTRGLTILVSSFTAIVASKMAEKTFRDYCHNEFSCDGDVDTTVEDCTPEEGIPQDLIDIANQDKIEEDDETNFLGGKSFVKVKDLDNAIDHDQSKSYNRGHYVFRCKARGCVAHPYWKRKKNKEVYDAWRKVHGHCRNLKTDQYQYHDMTDISNYYSVLRPVEELEKEAEKSFLWSGYHVFCREASHLSPETMSSACEGPESYEDAKKKNRLRCKLMKAVFRGEDVTRKLPLDEKDVPPVNEDELIVNPFEQPTEATS